MRGSMDGVLELVDHLHERFLYPCSINKSSRYNVPRATGMWSASRSKAEVRGELLTSAGWLGCSDENIGRLTREAVDTGFKHFKMACWRVPELGSAIASTLELAREHARAADRSVIPQVCTIWRPC